MAIPEHIAEGLHRMLAADAARRGMELLLQIDAAETILLERIDGEGRLQLAHVAGRDGPREAEAKELAAQGFYGRPLSPGSGLAGLAFDRGSALLVMGRAEAGEVTALPPALQRHLVGDGGGNVGYVYVLTLADGGGRPLGALTLLRRADEGPLNHEQPNLTEGMRRLLAELLSR